MNHHQLGRLSGLLLGFLCVARTPAMLGIPFPSQRTVEYYQTKMNWAADKTFGPENLIGGWLREHPDRVRYFRAATSATLGIGLMTARYRRYGAIGLLSIVGPGTLRAIKDDLPILPQIGVLSGIALALL